jgi:hypothetical protein
MKGNSCGSLQSNGEDRMEEILVIPGHMCSNWKHSGRDHTQTSHGRLPGRGGIFFRPGKENKIFPEEQEFIIAEFFPS